MTHTFQITDLRKNSYFDLNEGATDGVQLSLENIQLFTRDKQPIFHVGSDGTQQMIACHEGARGASFAINLGGTRNTAFNRLHRLNRWLERAIEAELNPDNSWPIYLKIKLDGATNATVHRIQFGMTDPSGAVLTPFSAGAGTDTEIWLWMVGVTLVLYPTGTLENPYYMNNMLHNGAFDRWNAAETEPMGWEAVSGGVLAKAIYRGLIGRFSCKVTAGANNRGIRSDSVPIPAGHLSILSAWVIVESGTWKLQIWSGGELVALQNVTAAALAANTGGIVQDTALDRAGNTWYLIKIAQVDVTNDRNMFVRWTLQTGDTGVSWIDGVQLHTVEAENRFPDPHIQSFGNGTPWGDFFRVSDSYIAAGQDTDHHFDADGEFVATASGLVVTLSTLTSTAGHIRTVLMAPNRQDDSWMVRFWMRFVSDGATTLRATLYDGGDNVVDYVDITEETIAAVDVQSGTGGDTETWYQIQLDGTNSNAPGGYVKWEATATGSGADMSFYLDELFVYTGTGPVFNNAFISDWTMLNRNDYDDSNESRFNYFHLFNLPGDAPCRIKLTGYVVGADAARQIWLATAHEQRYPYIQHSYEAEEGDGYWTPNTGARWTDTTDGGGATESGGSYNRFASTSDTPTLTAGRDYIKMSIPDATRLEENHRWGARPLRVFARARTSEKESAYINFELATQNETVTRANTYRTFTADDTWEWVDLGPLLLHYNDDGLRTAHNVSGVLRIYVECDNGETVDIDKVEFLPTPDGGYGRWRFYEFGTFGQFLLDGVKEEMTYLTDGTDIPTPYSGVYKFLPGHIAHVVIAGTANGSNAHTIGDKLDFTSVAIYPQTTHLLGTI